MKFYTEQGNYDRVGNNTPIFFIRDPQKFSDFIHSQKRRADTHLHDNNMQWEVWPHSDYPPITVGRFTLNTDPENYFAEIEQASFEPANFVPGIGPSPDKMPQGRLFSYPDTHRRRIGPNYLQLPVNRPKSPVHCYNKDGAMRYDNPGDPVYAPNSVGGPAAAPQPWHQASPRPSPGPGPLTGKGLARRDPCQALHCARPVSVPGLCYARPVLGMP